MMRTWCSLHPGRPQCVRTGNLTLATVRGAVRYGPLMDLQRIRSRMDRSVQRLRVGAGVKAWDCFAALQSSKPLDSSFVLWTSPAGASRLTSATPLKPYLCHLQRTTLIEPQYLFAIADYGLLIETSVSNAYAARDPALREFFALPSPAAYLKARFLRRHRADLEAVVALGIAWPFNYFHFYRDFLPKILLLEEADIDPAIPVLVPDALYDQPFFREAIQSKRLSRWNFISPRSQFVRTKSVVFCSANQFILMDRSVSSEHELLMRGSTGTKYLESPAEVLALLDLDDDSSRARAERRIFLTRSGTRGRNLSNYEEIEPILRERNFETVDTDGMSLRAQAQLFRECRYLIGIHGAGLTNIIHAHARDLSLLQLRQPGEERLLTDFALMCHSFGFDHQEIFGTSEPRSPNWVPSGPRNRDGPFRVDVAILRAAIDRMLAPPLSHL